MTDIAINGQICSNDDKRIFELWFGVSATAPKDVRAALEKAKGAPVTLRINSYGGDVASGSEIYTMLSGYAGGVTAVIESVAASCASMIAMAASRVEMAPTALFMLHNPWTVVQGDYQEMEKQGQVARTVAEAISAAYERKTGKSRDEIKALMDAETWYDAKGAVDAGLCDAVYEGAAGGDVKRSAGSAPKIALQNCAAMARFAAFAARQGFDGHDGAPGADNDGQTGETLGFARYTAEIYKRRAI